MGPSNPPPATVAGPSRARTAGAPRRPPRRRARRLLSSCCSARSSTAPRTAAAGPCSTGLPPLHSYVSELAAEGEPYGTFFRTADLLAGLLVLAGAVGALLWSGGRGWARVGWAGLALFGAATAADSRLPLSCTPTASAGCAARQAAGDVPWTHAAHAVSSGLAVAGALLGMAAFALAARRGAGRWPVLAAAGPVLLVLGAVATGWTRRRPSPRSPRGTGHGGSGQGSGSRCWSSPYGWRSSRGHRRPRGPRRSGGRDPRASGLRGAEGADAGSDDYVGAQDVAFLHGMGGVRPGPCGPPSGPVPPRGCGPWSGRE
ncbi:hypothetical protein SALBM135S_06472 [Streptomyces alboniger]